MGLTAWSNGMDTWTSAPSSGLSQGYTINHVDQGAAREILYGRDQEAIFYGNLAQSDLAHLSNYQTLSGGALDSLTVSFQYGTFTVYYTNLYSTAYFPENSFWGRPPGTIWGPLTLPFAPDPQKPIIPKCPPGYHPT